MTGQHIAAQADREGQRDQGQAFRQGRQLQRQQRAGQQHDHRLVQHVDAEDGRREPASRGVVHIQVLACEAAGRGDGPPLQAAVEQALGIAQGLWRVDLGVGAEVAEDQQPGAHRQQQAGPAQALQGFPQQAAAGEEQARKEDGQVLRVVVPVPGEVVRGLEAADQHARGGQGQGRQQQQLPGAAAAQVPGQTVQ
eukprot:Opistho-2@56204